MVGDPFTLCNKLLVWELDFTPQSYTYSLAAWIIKMLHTPSSNPVKWKIQWSVLLLGEHMQTSVAIYTGSDDGYVCWLLKHIVCDERMSCEPKIAAMKKIFYLFWWLFFALCTRKVNETSHLPETCNSITVSWMSWRRNHSEIAS